MNSIKDQYTIGETGNLGKMLINLFDHWGLSTGDQLELLGMSSSNRGALGRFREGKSMSGSRDQLDRAGILLGIHKNLRLLFPHNRELAYQWMTTPNRAFEGKTPVEMVVIWGFTGLLMVRAYLDSKRGS